MHCVLLVVPQLSSKRPSHKTHVLHLLSRAMDFDLAAALEASRESLRPWERCELEEPPLSSGGASSGDPAPGGPAAAVVPPAQAPSAGLPGEAAAAAAVDAQPSKRRADPRVLKECSMRANGLGQRQGGKWLLKQADLDQLLGKVWGVAGEAVGPLLSKGLAGIGPSAEPYPVPGFFDLSLLPGVLWHANVGQCLLPVAAWDKVVRNGLAATSARGTSLAQAQAQQPKGRATGKRKPESVAGAMARHRGGKKSRTVSHRDDHEDVAGEVPEHGVPEERFAYVAYTRDRSPACDRRGRRLSVGWAGSGKYVSEKHLERLEPVDFGNGVLDLGFLPDRRDETCGVRLKTGALCPGQLAVRAREGQATLRCCGKGACQRFVRLNETVRDAWPSGIPLKDQVLMAWHYANPMVEPSPVRVAETFGLFPRTVRDRFDRWRSLVADHTERINNEMRLGGWNEATNAPREIEMDEVLLRSVGVLEDGEPKVRTVRWCGMGERGHPSTFLLFRLPDRTVEAGGGGPISSEELDKVLLLKRPEGEGCEAVFRILPKSVIHTDSAKAAPERK